MSKLSCFTWKRVIWSLCRRSVPTGRKRREDLRAGTIFGQNSTLMSKLYHITNKKEWRKCELKKKKSEMYRNEIKSYIVRAGMTMSEVVDYLADEYGWSSSVPNLSGKLKRGSLRYGEAVELADALGYDIVWMKRG